MDVLFYCMVALTGFCGMGVLASVMMSRTSRATSQRMLMVLQGQEQAKPAAVRPKEIQKKLLGWLHSVRQHLGMSEDPRVLDRLARAGLFGGSYADVYLAARVFFPVVGVVVGSCISWNRAMCIATLAGVAYLAPDFVLQRLIKRRREKVRLGVPDAIDLLVICVDAGLGMDQAMLRVGVELAKSHPEIHQEFLRINREQRAGKLRLDAWQSMAERNQLPELDAFVNMLMQTERFGTPIARALSNFGDGIRLKRRQKAEELAAKTTVKIIFPLVFFIFPSIFIVLLGPPGINIARGLASGQ